MERQGTPADARIQPFVSTIHEFIQPFEQSFTKLFVRLSIHTDRCVFTGANARRQKQVAVQTRVQREECPFGHLFRQRCYPPQFRGHGIGRRCIRRVSRKRFHDSMSPFPVKAPVEHQFAPRGPHDARAVWISVLWRHSDSCRSVSRDSLLMFALLMIG